MNYYDSETITGYSDADIEMAEAADLSNRIDRVTKGPVNAPENCLSVAEVEALMGWLVRDINSYGIAADSPSQGLTQILEDYPEFAARCTSEQFDGIVWEAWELSDVSKEKNY